jgi:hypothetical protein
MILIKVLFNYFVHLYKKRWILGKLYKITQLKKKPNKNLDQLLWRCIKIYDFVIWRDIKLEMIDFNQSSIELFCWLELNYSRSGDVHENHIRNDCL